MSPHGAGLLGVALKDPLAPSNWTLPQWEELVRQARRTNLLARLAVTFEDMQLLHAVPGAPRAHLDAALVFARAQEHAIRREVVLIQEALAPTGIGVVLLKGAAYLMMGLPGARGRLFSDIDILVPKTTLPQVEAALMLRGWATTHHHPYDQRYYRQWMHELPPLRHVSRLTVLDVHHAILPTTARLKPDAEKLLAAAVLVEEDSRFRVLAPVDMVLHSATHLFYNEEFSHGLRDLVDLDSLLRHFSRQDGFWKKLTARAIELNLIRPLYYALRYAAGVMGTDVPADVVVAAQAGEPVRLRRLMDALFTRVLTPEFSAASVGLSSVARRMLYIRAHWLRMPPHLLAWHLTVKALRREELETKPEGAG